MADTFVQVERELLVIYANYAAYSKSEVGKPEIRKRKNWQNKVTLFDHEQTRHDRRLIGINI